MFFTLVGRSQVVPCPESSQNSVCENAHKKAHKDGVELPYGNSVLVNFSENTPENCRLGKAFRLGAYGTLLETYVFAATHKHPMSVLPEPDVMGYDGGNATACHDQLVAFLQANPPVDGDDLPRALAFEIAHKVGERHCSHAPEPQPLSDMSHAAHKKAAAEHPGLCGLYHAHLIAAVETSDVIEKWGEHNLTANKYRNQVCDRPSGSRLRPSSSAPQTDGGSGPDFTGFVLLLCP